MVASIFAGCIPALMTPCKPDRTPDFAALVRKGKELIGAGMSAVVYCGSMGDWPLLTDEQRQEGVSQLVKADVPVIVGTGAQNSARAAAHAAHAKHVGAKGLMVIPRVLSRGISVAAQRAHFAQVLEAAVDLPSVIYNSPYYGFETKADLFFDLRKKFPHLVGFKEFGGGPALRYAAEHITNRDTSLTLMVGVDTQVFHGFVNCGAAGAITGIGNVLPKEILHLVALCEARRNRRCARHGASPLNWNRHSRCFLPLMRARTSFSTTSISWCSRGVLNMPFTSTKQIPFLRARKAYATRQLTLFKDWYRELARR